MHKHKRVPGRLQDADADAGEEGKEEEEEGGASEGNDAGDLRRILSHQCEGKAEDEQEDGDENGGDNVRFSRRATQQPMRGWTPE